MKEYEMKDNNVVNTIANGTEIQGNIITSNSCRIEGHVKGNVTCKAKVIIGANGIVEGDITCDSIDIEGKLVTETLNANDLVSLKATAKFKGNILTDKISIEPGAEFSGNCQMHGSSKAKPAATAAESVQKP